ncbi:DHA2 family efflux MFS transporter permease subunit [Arthrobacter sedimenti]|uniref:DHA2 family efflux MFS transporter permease subunit n=1 Tax=Arthrobacter sedimenti TaxID=2694931 RepID=UPI0014202EE1|nr:DHA2 family efflux MFS transporter permease subunit [Arthrobacter sedimenti]
MSTNPEKLTSDQIITIVVLAASAFIALVSELVMGVALPTIMAELKISASTGQWLTTGYALTLAVIIPTTGYLLRRFRSRPIFAVSMGLFSLGTLIATLAPSFEVLLAARVVQALGTGVLVPMLLTTTFGMVAPARRGQMMAMVTAVISVAPAIAPAFSGLVMAQLSWRWLFIIILPFALLGLILGALKIPNPSASSGSGFDVLSFVLAAVGFGALVYGLSTVGEGAGAGIPVSFWVAVPLGLLGVGAFVVRQLRLQRNSTPLMNMRIFSRRAFTMSIVQFGFLVAGAFSLSVLLPLVLQESFELGVFETGLFMAPGGVMIVVVSVFAGKVYDRMGARTLVVSGAVVIAAGWWFMSTVDQAVPVWVVLVTFLVICAGQALSWTPIYTLALGSLPDELHAHGSAALNTVQQLVGAAGLAVLVGIFTIHAKGSDPTSVIVGAQAAFAAGGVIAAAGIVAAIFLPSRARNAPLLEAVSR